MQLTDLAFPASWLKQAAPLVQALLANDNYLICAHARLDGDALSSMAAMGHFLAQHGKKFQLYTPCGVPDDFAFFKLPAPAYCSLKALPCRPDVVLALDCGNPDRLGEELAAKMDRLACINIDHHVGPGMGTIASLVIPEAASTTQVLASVFRQAGCELAGDLAEALALGLVTDTGGFRHANATPAVFALAAYLEQQGVSVHSLREKLEKNWTLARMRLWGRLADRIQLLEENRLAFCAMPIEVLAECGAGDRDIEGFVEHMRDLRKVQASCFVREQNAGVCKFSLRSAEGVDVRKAAAALGGGGHTNAAGGVIRKPLAEACKDLQKVLADVLADASDDEERA